MKWIVLFCFSGFLVACNFKIPATKQTQLQYSRVSDDEGSKRSSRRSGRKGRTNSQAYCSQDSSCKQICYQDLFSKNDLLPTLTDDEKEDILEDLIEDCYDFSVDEVEEFQQIKEAIEYGSVSTKKFLLDDIEELLDFAIQAINVTNATNATNILRWIADDENVAALFENADEHQDFIFYSRVCKERGLSISSIDVNNQVAEDYFEKANEHFGSTLSAPCGFLSSP